METCIVTWLLAIGCANRNIEGVGVREDLFEEQGSFSEMVVERFCGKRFSLKKKS